MNIPNLLTFIRLLLIPVFFVVFYLPFKWSKLASAAIFALAAITDWLDGYLARKLNQTSALGRFLDPVADKLVVVTALVLLVAEHANPYLAIPAAIIVSREILISALREWMAESGHRSRVAVSIWGKVKTAAQFLAIILLLSQGASFNNPIVLVGYSLLYVAVLLTLLSMWQYLQAAWADLTK